MKHASIAFYSASGNTRRVAEWIADELALNNINASFFKIPECRNAIPPEMLDTDLLIIGTPTYMWHTPPVVIEFLNAIETLNNLPVGLFVTFGNVTVGSNLSYMARKIRGKQGKLVGAMQLEGEHAMMFHSGNPLAKGKPLDTDTSYVKKFVNHCMERANPSRKGIQHIPGIMKYFAFMASPKIARKIMPAIQFASNRCNLCGDCVKSCPTGNITIHDKSVLHGNDCLLCYNCVRACTAGATSANLLSMDKGLRIMSKLPEKDAAVY
jgi:ferredoxin